MGKPRNTQKYLTYSEIPKIPGTTRVKKIPGNTRSYFSTLLPDPNPTRYTVFCPLPDPILKNPTRWALSVLEQKQVKGQSRKLALIKLTRHEPSESC